MQMKSPFHSNVLSGRVAVITGGGSGIGFGIAQELARHGARIVITGRRKQFLADAVKILTDEGFQASYLAGDVRKFDNCESVVNFAVSKYGSLDILVCSHAGNFLAPAETLSSNGFRTVIDIDTVGVFNICRAAFAPLKKSQGSIIHISATLQIGASWYQIHASAAKAAIDSITRSLALEWGSYGIRVNGIAPGAVNDTPGLQKLTLGMSAEKVNKMLGPLTPLGRICTKFDIAMVIIFLCSAGGAFLTGETILMDGGAWLAGPAPFPRDVAIKMSRSVESKSRQMGAQSKM
uniref:Peroxisomal 2,4-dienoyl-CoA reductase [(3E)-enoyl-CoA-producing] n=1 Tax=Hirondellea gigas TaxID=1518452 RepID=A0A2P2I4P4_9CRUS